MWWKHYSRFVRTLLKFVSFPKFLTWAIRNSHLFWQLYHKFQGYTLKSRWQLKTDQQGKIAKTPGTAMLLQHKLLTMGKCFQVLLVSHWDCIRRSWFPLMFVKYSLCKVLPVGFFFFSFFLPTKNIIICMLKEVIIINEHHWRFSSSIVFFLFLF